LQALVDYGPRYERVLRESGIEFRPPTGISAFDIEERLEGDATTDFGAPGVAPSADVAPVDDAELGRLETILRSCWRAFDAAATAAHGKTLRLGPRGGGRDLHEIVRHILGGEAAYLSRLAWRIDDSGEGDPLGALPGAREAVLRALETAVRSGMPERGPRGGRLWTPRYFVRRVAWHALDHAWEIEDRTENTTNTTNNPIIQ
jgi:hypothetical protein